MQTLGSGAAMPIRSLTRWGCSLAICEAAGVRVMLHSHGFRETVDGKLDIISVDEIRMVKIAEAGKEYWQQ